MNIMIYFIGLFMLLAILLTFIRFIKGPTLFDRIAAIDVFTLITTVLIVILSIIYNNKLLVDVAIVYAILSFIGVVAFARFMEKKND